MRAPLPGWGRVGGSGGCRTRPVGPPGGSCIHQHEQPPRNLKKGKKKKHWRSEATWTLVQSVVWKSHFNHNLPVYIRTLLLINLVKNNKYLPTWWWINRVCAELRNLSVTRHLNLPRGPKQRHFCLSLSNVKNNSRKLNVGGNEVHLFLITLTVSGLMLFFIYPTEDRTHHLSYSDLALFSLYWVLFIVFCIYLWDPLKEWMFSYIKEQIFVNTLHSSLLKTK